MIEIPHDNHLESSLALAREGYTYIQRRCEELGSDIFQARLMFQPTICMIGEEAARVFYDTNLFQRTGAAPLRMQKTLLGQGSVQSLDDDAHRVRKAMFMEFMSAANIDRLAGLVAREWEQAITTWQRLDRVVLLDQVHELHCRAVCTWAGVPLPEADVKKRTSQMVALIESPAKVGPRHWQGREARHELEDWCARLIDLVRAGRMDLREDQPLKVIALHQEADGQLLNRRVAAVELLNVLRPTVAIGRFVVFAALALHDNPQDRQVIASGKDELIPLFIQETRRFYPFFPFAVARVRRDFTWRGYHFPSGRRVLLDLYGTNHDSRIWRDPARFMPERFRGWHESPFTLIPQGGSDHYRQHRCAGEWITLSLMSVAVRALTRGMTYQVPDQNLRISMARMPAKPRSGFVISEVKRIY